ncbi:autotransporter outer membrane beta-barrel domain-containing protein [Methylophilus sp. OH31]|uniref:autotransporter family protein n=1 Tax=Methylophilus sp. OH31 TaxID=1387312 RepID=UPI00046598F0|nr:autotransporter outer membrane beta-barrel domain-containing protein [Methylophilus sp. OH31]
MKKIHHIRQQALTDAGYTAKLSRQALLASAIIAAMPMLAGHALAASSCGAGGSIQISSIETDYCAPTANETVTITSTGGINIPANTNRSAIESPSSATGVSFINNGSIISDRFALENYGHIDSFINNGSMDSRDFGAVVNVGNIDSFINNGSINNVSYFETFVNLQTMGAFVNNAGATITSQQDAAFVNQGTIDSITNHGTITSGSISFYAVDNRFGTVTNGIINTGTLDGLVGLGSAALALNGNSGRITGNVSGGTSSSVTVNGTFTAESDFNVGSFNVANGAIFNMAHEFTTSNGFTNAGTMALANPAAIIAGNYTQLASGTLSISVNSANAYDYSALWISGNANFATGTKLFINVSQANTLAVNDVISSVITTNGHNATANTFSVSDNSALFNFNVIINGNNIDLETVLGRTVSSSIIGQGFTQATGAARVLDAFVAGTPSGDMVNVVDAFANLGSEREVSNAVGQTLPLMSASIDQVTTNGMRATNRIIQARQEANVGRASGDQFLGDKYVWLKPIASHANQGNHNGVAGYQANTYGFIAGADAELNDTHRLGVAFAYMNSNVDGRSTAHYNRADIDAYQLITYGSFNLLSNPDIEINWQADFGVNKNDGHRRINFGGLNRVAKSDFDSTTAHIGAGVGRSIQLNEKTTFTPSVRADYFWIRNDAYTEKGASALNLKVDSATSEQLIAMVEGRLRHLLTERAALIANVGLGYDLLDNQNSIAASYVGGGPSFRTQGLGLSPWIARAGVGVSVHATELAEITARYDVDGRSDFVGQTASINVRMAF